MLIRSFVASNFSDLSSSSLAASSQNSADRMRSSAEAFMEGPHGFRLTPVEFLGELVQARISRIAKDGQETLALPS
jgi:hypothetical protein